MYCKIKPKNGFKYECENINQNSSEKMKQKWVSPYPSLNNTCTIG
jgi:hypothetical protein